MGFELLNKVVMQLTARGKDLNSNQILENVWHFHVFDPLNAYGSSVAGSDSTVLLGSFRTQFRDVLSLLASSLVMIDYTLTEILGVDSPTRLHYGATDLILGVVDTDVGGHEGETLPDYAAYSCQIKTGFAGRHRRGSKRFGPVAETDNNNGAVIPGTLSALQDAIDPFTSGLICKTAGGTPFAFPGVFSRTTALITATPWTTEQPFFARVTAFKMHPNLGSQNSRKPRLDEVVTQL